MEPTNKQKNANFSINEQTQPTTEPNNNTVYGSSQLQPQLTSATPLPQQTNAQTNPPTPAKKPNGKFIIILTIIFILIIGGVIAGLFLSGIIKFGDTHFTNIYPTPELAKSVCEKHGGKYTTEVASSDNYSPVYYCEKTDDNSTFEYKISFPDKNKIEEYRDSVKTSFDDPNVRVLENSDSFLKALVSPSEEYLPNAYVLVAIYENAVIELETIDGSLGEDLLAELGFPDRNRNESYVTIEAQEVKGMNESKSDIQHREALSEVSYLMTLFQTNNRGQLPTISNGNLTGFEAYLEESSLNYSVIGFESFEESEFATAISRLHYSSRFLS